MSLLSEALQLACELHEGQERKDKKNGIALPYVVHPIEVLKKNWDWGISDEPTLLASVLHDTWEDCKDKLDKNKFDRFGSAVSIIDELTFSGGDKAEYLRSFKNKSVESLVIKIADRICNVWDFYRVDYKYAHKYFDKAADLLDLHSYRKDEIIKKYGLDVHRHMLGDINAMTRFLCFQQV